MNIGRCLNFVTGFKNAVTKGTNWHNWSDEFVWKLQISYFQSVPVLEAPEVVFFCLTVPPPLPSLREADVGDRPPRPTLVALAFGSGMIWLFICEWEVFSFPIFTHFCNFFVALFSFHTSSSVSVLNMFLVCNWLK